MSDVLVSESPVKDLVLSLLWPRLDSTAVGVAKKKKKKIWSLRGAEKIQGLKKKGPCLMAKKPEGRFLPKEGSSPERYKPKVGLWSG